jgi:hypothetical protein
VLKPALTFAAKKSEYCIDFFGRLSSHSTRLESLQAEQEEEYEDDDDDN